MQFRLITVLYVFALLAAGMATFGGWGIAFAGGVLLFWGMIIRGKFTILEAVVVVTIIAVLFGLLLPAVQAARESSRVNFCKNNLKQLAVALQYYESKHGKLPPAVTADKNGTPLYSWRLSILPYLEGEAIYKQWNRDVAFDAPGNAALAKTPIDVFTCPSDPPVNANAAFTNYFAVTGPETAWANEQGGRLEEITDPPDQTIFLMEAVGREVLWADPRDLSFTEAVNILTGKEEGALIHSGWRDGPSYRRDFVYEYGINVVMADGSVRYLGVPMPENLASALLTARGGEDTSKSIYNYDITPRYNYARLYSLCVFVLLSLLPGYVLWRRRRNEIQTKAAAS